jgi:hypothetical protein
VPRVPADVSATVFTEALAFALGGVFAIAGARKLRDPRVAITQFDAYALLPAGCGRWLALPLAGFELLASGGCMLPATRGVSALLLALLLMLYSAAVALNLWRGNIDIDCGCGSLGGEPPLGIGLLLRNVMLLAAALACTRLRASEPSTMTEWMASVLLAALLLALYAAVNAWLARDRWLRDD